MNILTSVISDKFIIQHPPAPYYQGILANGFIFLYGSILAIVIIALVLSSIIDFLLIKFSKDEAKIGKRKKELKSYLKTIPVFLLPCLIIFLSARFGDLRISYMTSGMGDKIYHNSDFERIACYTAIIDIFSFIMVIIGVIRLFKKKTQSDGTMKKNIIWIVLFVIMTILYLYASLELLQASM